MPMAIFGERVCYLPLKTNRRDKSKLERMREGIWLGIRMRTNEALIGTPAGVVKARIIRTLPEDEKWSAAMILEVRGTPRRPNPLVDDDNVPEDIDEITFDHRGHDDRDKDHEGKESQEPVPVRMSDIVPRTATEEAWRSMHVTRRLIIQYGETPGAPVARASERRMVQATRQNADSGCTMRCRPAERARSSWMRSRRGEMPSQPEG